MQSLTVPAIRNPNLRTPADILAALRGSSGSRSYDFRYELVDSTGAVLGDLDGIVDSCSVEQNWLADIKRTARLQIRDTGEIDYLSDQIRPYVRWFLPPYGPADWVEWPQGTFLLSSAKRKGSAAGVVTRDVVAYDRLQIFMDAKVTDRYAVAAGAVVTSAVKTLLDAAGVPYLLAPSTSTLPTAKEWEPGTTQLKIINDLLDVINYNSLSFDEDGRALVQPYRLPSDRPDEYTYADDTDGLIVPEVEQELDLFGVANQWVLTVSDPDRPMLRSVYTNNSPGSPTSTVRRGRTITDFRTEQDAVDQATLDAKVARLAFEASQVYEAIPFDTALMPIHSGNDAYRLIYGPLAVNARYVEQSWSMDLRVGAKMKHRARRMVTV